VTTTNRLLDHYPGDRHTLAGHTLFSIFSIGALLLMFSLQRVGLFVYNSELAAHIATNELHHSFLLGMRFDMMVAAIFSVPLLAGFIFSASESLRKYLLLWLSFATSISIFLGISELDFYREFHQRLNSLVFEYIRQDPKTVISMLWNGFPVARYLALWLFTSWLMYRFYGLLDHIACIIAQKRAAAKRNAVTKLHTRIAVFVFALLFLTISARGTVRQGPPLRWGDAFHSKDLFANHLALNGVFTLYKAAAGSGSKSSKNYWLNTMPIEQATEIVKHWLFTDRDQAVPGSIGALLRKHTPETVHTEGTAPPNIVVILMESFSGAFVGALGNEHQITPEFDALAKQGLLFTRFFSNGTHTHQGMFATLACFPNIPGYEYLMNTQEGSHQFSGLPLLLSQLGYQNVYVYNGSFSWDNQEGFFRNQSMTRFVGRDDMVNPKFKDPTWGVSDEDMFNRAVEELDNMPKDKPFFAMLQTLSNHTPYALPTPLPVQQVTQEGEHNEHLTAMRYADWALGQFFKTIEKKPYYQNTIFLLVGDHGFGISQQLTDIDLLRFRVPMLILGPHIQARFGTTSDRVATQVDIAPTLTSLVGKPFTHQCWGRDLLSLHNDPGFGLIKPSGNDEIVGFIADNNIVVKRPQSAAQLYNYQMSPAASATTQDNPDKSKELEKTLHAFVERATTSLLNNTTGVK
jgi:phosphoglycerol transferase MdoB-like AlkP superfamily enzyme